MATMIEYRDMFAKRMKEMGHDPILNKEGDMDVWVVDHELHNGPGCKKCGKSWCYHCKGIEDIRPCVGK